jgi:membrane protein DedA with SNARE-associated domain
VVLGDLLIYHWGSRLGPAAYNHRRIQKHLSPDRQQKLRSHFARHGFLTVVVGWHTPMLRAPIFFLAGASGVPPWKFALADYLAAAVTVPVVVTLGFYFGDRLDHIRKWIQEVEWAVAAVALLLLGAWWLVRRRIRTRLRSPSPR